MFRSSLALCFFASVVQADVTVTFSEGAPKDRFTIQTTAGCVLEPLTVAIELGDSAAGLIFDTAPTGAGVEVFQPFEVVSGGDQIAVVSPVKDGDNKVMFRLSSLSAASPVAFTIDVDDTLGGREITVSGSEIEGAKITVVHQGEIATALFGTNAVARAPVAGCTS